MDNFTTTSPPGNSTEGPCDPIPGYWGYITVGVAIIFYGSNFAPVKKFETGDGMFFQWIMCVGAFLVGIPIQLIMGSPEFYPLVMLGGLIWETGNVCVVPIIKTIGMGLGLCIWGMTNLLSGWASARFGMFGIKQELPDNVALNYAGVSLAVSSAFIFAMVRNEVSIASVTISQEPDREPLLRGTPETVGDAYISIYQSHGSVNMSGSIAKNSPPPDESLLDRQSPTMKRIIGIVLSMISGLLYGQTFTPMIYVQDNYKGASANALDYVFALFCGILTTSTVYFGIYSAFMGNKPKIFPRAILPGFISGLMWGIATACWTVANKTLSEPVSFPIVTTGPAVIASLWGVLVFKEIRGLRNILILLLGFAITGSGAVLAALSKKAVSHRAC